MITIETVGQISNEVGSLESILALIGGLVIGLFRAHQNRKAARQIARSIEVVKTAEGLVNFADTATASQIRHVAGARGRVIVDEAQGKRKAKPF